ncbi:fibronectin type III domain-containing protein [Actinoplanes sp. NPDC049599]|uniref:fibronectin type III domain-containing protein n=1 Tax=Actinoplanes sp. NPDC049599 TaxID=3363903 RepID=UPI0037B4BED1
MACTPLAIPTGLFYTDTVWRSTSETRSTGRSATYAPDGSLVVSGPNGSTRFTPAGNELVRHMFFGSANHLAVLRSGKIGAVERRVYLIDFDAAPTKPQNVMFVSALATDLFPWLQYSGGSGDVCCIGAPGTGVGVQGLRICRSDNGLGLLTGPANYLPKVITQGRATTTELQIVDGTVVLARTPLPAGRCQVSPSSQMFPAVILGGPGPATSTRQFTVTNSGTDCLRIDGVGRKDPFSGTGPSVPFPAGLGPGASMSVTVIFAPAAAGSWTSVTLPISRTPALGDDKLTCSGSATVRDAAPPTWPAGAVLTADAVTREAATLHWTAAQDDRGIAGYRVYQDAALIASPGAAARQHTATRLAPNTEYAFRIEAVDAAGNLSTGGPTVRVRTAPPLPPAVLDQVNDPAWSGAAVNIVPANRDQQVVVPTRRRLRAVEVALVNGNPQYGGDQVTLTVSDATGAVLLKTTAAVPPGFDGFWRFDVPGDGAAVTVGAPLTLTLQDTGRNAFWWKYQGGDSYPAGTAYFAGQVFHDNDFLFRTYGSD